MEVWNLVRLKNQLDSMREHKRGTTEEQVIYLLNPFVASLGYDIYDVGQVDVQVSKGRIVVRPVPNVNVVFSVTSMTPSNAKVFVHIDMKRATMNIQMFAMNKWETVDTVSLDDLTEPNSSIYSSVLRVIAQEAFQIMYAEREERMFTERILRSKLESGQMNNDFTVATLKQLFDKPTETFLLAIAEVLSLEYSTDDRNELYGLLQPMQEQGIRGIVSEYMKDIPTTDDKPKKPSTQVDVAPAYEEQKPTYVKPMPAYDEPIVEPVVTPIAKLKPTPTVVEEPKTDTEPTPVPTVEVTEKPVEKPTVEPTVEPSTEMVTEPSEEPKEATKMNDLLNAIKQTAQDVEEEKPKKPKGEVPMDKVLGKKATGNNIAEMFGGSDTRKPPRTKSL